MSSGIAEAYYIMRFLTACGKIEGLLQSPSNKHLIFADNEKISGDSIRKWQTKLEDFILWNCDSLDVHKNVRRILIEEKTFKQLSSYKKDSDSSIVINSTYAVNKKDIEYVMRCELSKLYTLAGYQLVLEKIFEEYSRNDDESYLESVLELLHLTRFGLKIAPLEHGLYIIRYSLNHHF